MPERRERGTLTKRKKMPTARTMQCNMVNLATRFKRVYEEARNNNATDCEIIRSSLVYRMYDELHKMSSIVNLSLPSREILLHVRARVAGVGGAAEAEEATDLAAGPEIIVFHSRIMAFYGKSICVLQ